LTKDCTSSSGIGAGFSSCPGTHDGTVMTTA
jgi:hypothetical protein